jgi:hypothetical protein
MFGAVMLLVFALLGVNIWAIVDVARRPEHQWKAIKQDRTLWLVLTLLAGLPCSIAYLVAIRPKLDAIPTQLALPGWYPDPALPGYVRWHDGTEWTAHAMPMLPPAPGWGPPQHHAPQHHAPQHHAPQPYPPGPWPQPDAAPPPPGWPPRH